MSATKVAIRVAILTVSDSAAAGEREDLSGPAVAQRCLELGWTVTDSKILADEPGLITAQLERWIAERDSNFILTTGGTGIAARDVTPEATRSVIQKELPGLAELMRMRGLEQTPMSVLSRAVAGISGGTLIVNLPGSTAGAVHSLRAIEHLVSHAVHLLAGETAHV